MVGFNIICFLGFFFVWKVATSDSEKLYVHVNIVKNRVYIWNFMYEFCGKYVRHKSYVYVGFCV